MAATAVLAFVGVGGATAAVTLTGNITAVDAEEALGEDRPDKVVPDDPNAGVPLNILVLGSDSREGVNADVVADGNEGARADTTMILHISADRSRVEVVSVPRDSTVDIPSCPTSSGGETAPLYKTKFNAAFASGYDTGGDVESGALCVMKTLETLTDVRMDGFVVVDFAGFQKMIDAIGGVEICIPQRIESRKADNLVLEAGVQELDGLTALKYARARTGAGLGDGSDIGRIGRQQELMAALARTVLDQNLLTDSPQLLQFLGAVTGSLTMSSNFASVQGLAGLAYSVRNVRPDTIAFMTVPFEYDPDNPANVVWTSEAADVWDNMNYDRPLSDAVAQPEAEASPSPSTSAGEGTAGEQPAAPEEPAPSEEAPEAEPAPDAASPEPSPTRTREAGKEAFTSADVTAVCGSTVG
ncbi:LytR family transcriptional attenuator [Isoptericola variabilis J7]|uniref:Cell envelope-related transcriptional attenuator n=2 Tax=Isoptericola TaxID=254250 RepID=F6FS31_ISOV2|nr:cell envelope-related transcriptional attenuator [Isoptericola variabilis 225]TWH32230.1 LytR family transcriptional attenuator [Isoptericola variabilis J7]